MIFLLLCAIAPFVHTHGIHESMSADEIKQVFQTTPDDVPEYEVVPVKHTFHKKADNYIVETAFQNSKITFNLKQTESILVGKHTKVWIGKKNSYHAHGIEYNLIENAFENIGTFYEDPQHLATFRIMDEHEDDDEDKMNGLVQKPLLLDGTFTINGNNIVLRLLPKRHRLKREIQQSESSSSEENNTNFTVTYNHVIFQIREPPHLEKSYRSANSFVKNSDGSEITRLSKRSIPEVAYPEIMLVVDEKIYLEFNGNVAKALSYIVTLWNGVDLRFRALSEPRVRLNIAGIILSEDKLPYIDSFFRDESRGHTALVANVTLFELGRYFYTEHRFSFKKDYDIALLMTGYDLQGIDQQTGQMHSGVAGIAYHKQACEQIEDFMIASVGLIEDQCDFSGILTAAHELGHLLGADHDDEGSLKCDHGFLMSGIHDNMIDPFQFTSCSQAEMRDFFQTESAECLFNAPPEDEPVPVILPGRYMSLDEQCRKRGHTKADNYDVTVCTELCCVPKTPEMYSYGYPCEAPAADGSPCEEDSYCLDGVCVYE